MLIQRAGDNCGDWRRPTFGRPAGRPNERHLRPTQIRRSRPHCFADEPTGHKQLTGAGRLFAAPARAQRRIYTPAVRSAPARLSERVTTRPRL